MMWQAWIFSQARITGITEVSDYTYEILRVVAWDSWEVYARWNEI